MELLVKMLTHIKKSREQEKLKKEYYRDAEKYGGLLKKCAEEPLFLIEKEKMIPVLYDKHKEAGDLDQHYFIQDIVMAKAVNDASPEVHYDIGSRVDGFIAHLLSADSVKKVVMMDVRPLSVYMDNLDFIQTDATSLGNIEDNSIESLSSLHAIEHFGLGRYGDPIDPNSWRDALNSIQSKIKRGGYFYFSVPVGPKNQLYFNAHRIFAPSTIINVLDLMELVSFKYIHDMEIHDVKIEQIHNLDSMVSEYDCGLFIFKKIG